MQVDIGSAAKIVEPGVRAGFDKGLAVSGANDWQIIADDWTSNSKTETYPRLMPTGSVREWDARREPRGATQQYFTVENTPYEITYRVEWDMILFDKLAQVNKTAEGYGRQMAMHPQKLLFELLADAFTTATYNGDDESYIVDTAHTDVGSGTLGNKGTTALGVDSLATARIAGLNMKLPSGEPIMINYDKLVVGPSLAQTAFELTTSPKDPENANNTPNWHHGLDVIVNPYLTDTNDWFLLCTNQVIKPMAVQFVERPTPMTLIDDRLKTDKYADYGAHMYGKATFTDWRLVYGASVT